MVREFITLEGHIIDSDILRRVFSRIVEGGGEFEVLEFNVGKRNDDPSFARIAVTAKDPHVLDRVVGEPELPRRLGGGRRRELRAGGSRRHPARRVLLDDQLRYLRARERDLGAGDGAEDGLRARVARGRARLREAAPGAGGRARRVARRGYPRAPARAEPRARGVRLHVERRLGRGEQEHRRRGHGAPRCGGHARPARRSSSSPDPPSSTPEARCTWRGSCARGGSTRC